MHRVVITGPESSGKTTLARALAQHFKVRCVEEQSRPYLEQSGGVYSERDLLAMAEWQLRAEEEVLRADPSAPVLVCDTDLLTIRIWGAEKYGRSDPWIVEQTRSRPYDLWLLCTPDMPWEPDPLRESPNDRERLFHRYGSLLEELHRPYMVLAGPHERRVHRALERIGVSAR